MPHLRLFASIREAAGCGRVELAGATVGDVLDAAEARFDESFSDLLKFCSVLVGESPAGRSTPVNEGDEIALLPPVSGG